MSDEQERGVEEWDQSYALKDTSTHWGDPPVPFVVAATSSWIDPDRPGLEIPCGDGRNTVPLGHHLTELTAIDSSERALALAASRAHAAGLARVTFTKGNVFDLPLPRSRFGSIVCWDLLGHLREPAAALRELVRVCAPGGTIVANVFSTGDSTRGEDMVEIDPGEYVYDEKFYFHYYDREDVDELLAGVEDIDVVRLELTRWTEPPHEGYREYEHEHESWAIVLEVES